MAETVTVRMKPELQAQLRAEAKERGVSLSKLIIERISAVEPGGAVEPPERVFMEGRSPMTDREATKAVTRDLRAEIAQETCTHPKNRQTDIIGAKKCLDCGRVRKMNSTVWR